MSQYMPLTQSLLERILPRLGFTHAPEPSLDSLKAIYGAWCQRVPFDNVRKLIHLRGEQKESPLPGTDAEDYFEAWLRYGTGGTCWAGSGALQALLSSLKFEAERCLATMMVAPDLPPNHGSVRVKISGHYYLVDTAMLYGEPLLLCEESEESCITHGAWGVRAQKREGLWQIRWRALHLPEGFDCRFNDYGVDRDEYRRQYEETRAWSPFNYQLTARRNRMDTALGASFGNAVTFLPNGMMEIRPIDDRERRRMLIEDFGISEEIVEQLPADQRTPPPPSSKTASATP